MEIKAQGDRVRIVLPNIDGIEIADGDVCPVPQGTPPEALDLVIDKIKSFALAITDKEKAQTQFKNWEDGMANAVGQKIAQVRAAEIERAIFDYKAGTAYAANTQVPSTTTVAQASNFTVYDPAKHPLAGEFGTDAAPLDLTPTAVYQLVLQVKMALIDSGAIAEDGTYDFAPIGQEAREMRGVFVCGTKLAAMLLQAYQLGFRSGEMGDMVVKDGVVTRVAGLDIHIDRVLDTIGTTGGQGAQVGDDTTAKAFVNLPFIAGTKNAITKAGQISKVETIRDPYCFQTNVRGMELYGFKILHPECLVRGVVKKPANVFDPKYAAIPVNDVNTPAA